MRQRHRKYVESQKEQRMMSVALPDFNWTYLAANRYMAACCCSDCGYRNLSITANMRNGITSYYRQHGGVNGTFSAQICPEFVEDRVTSTCCRGSQQPVSRRHVTMPSVPDSPSSSAALSFSIDEILRSDFGRHSDNGERRRSSVTSSSQSDQRGTSGQQQTVEKCLG